MTRVTMSFDQFAAALAFCPYQGGDPLSGLSARDGYLAGWEAFLHDQPEDRRWSDAKRRGWREAEARMQFARREA